MTKLMCGAECWTDQRLIVSKLNIRTQHERRPQGKKTPKRLNITTLKNIVTKQSFVDTPEERFDSTPTPPPLIPDSQNVETDWATLRVLVYNTATEILGPSSRKHKDWFDENCDAIKQLLDEKHRLHKAYFNKKFNKICHPSQRPRWQVDKEAIGLSRVQQCSSTYSPPS